MMKTFYIQQHGLMEGGAGRGFIEGEGFKNYVFFVRKVVKIQRKKNEGQIGVN